ncbi:MAG TPA: YmfQ family protein [Aliidongia sp.]|nr:YmfQ family protein [Aliidongia sp.]
MPTADQWQDALLKLLPPGAAFPRDPTGPMGRVLGAVADSLARCEARALDLVQVEADPRSTVEMLPDWEAALGLPDPCAGPSPTIELRRAQVVARYIGQGGQTAAYFISVAAALGYPITITPRRPSQFGKKFGTPFGGTAWAFTWQINAPTLTIRRFKFGAGAFGEPFTSVGNTVLICELQRLAPAHTIPLFKFG